MSHRTSSDEPIKIIEAASFTKAVKKLHDNQIRDLDEAVQAILTDVTIGEKKTADLGYMYVYKFKMVNQLTLLAYIFDGVNLVLTLLKVGPHENFYRDLKRQ